MLNQVIGQGVGAKLLGYHQLPFNWYCYLSCDTLWSSTKGTPVLIHRQWHPSAQRIQVHCGEDQRPEKPLCTAESSQDPRCSWGNDSSITAGWNGLLRLPWFCSPESSIAHLSHQPQASRKLLVSEVYHHVCPGMIQSLCMFHSGPPTHSAKVQGFRNGWGWEIWPVLPSWSGLHILLQGAQATWKSQINEPSLGG